ncbi:HTH domain-containing protein [Oceanispirochaeta sp.]|jgi:BirA family biotin operon repressor/biotin-[acetyl-CoA-carboxylase] ligase|uniref:biotin operon repressor n=1 Tax=Oceanispirochaeta sp. TaxID=2035350 RepID=UPI00262E074B|nr:HTH domain-containing protein [Oceanispirochaeta sp.]MDA3956108.1 HTH domain-containing protein [Oceanispirochaeta sp.]
MVNTTKIEILNQLKDSTLWHSGEQISREMGISRVAVWKQIKSLSEQGYPIESSPRGYRIIQEKDTLSALEFKPDSGILYYDELNSTMNEAQLQIIRQPGEVKNFLILADHQSGGVGRDQQSWDSPSGGIYLTFVTRNVFDRKEVPLMKKRGILTVLKTLAELKIPDLSYSPAGDLFLGKKKGAGVLEEYQVRGNKVQWFALGLGLHLNDSPEKTDTMTSVLKHSGKIFHRADIVRILKKNWESSLTLKAARVEEQLGDYPQRHSPVE